MTADPDLLSPDLLAQIADLELVARLVVDGLVSGLHRSPFHGYSAEFSLYRHYQPGDDLKYVDWKLAARTDRIYTKQFRETTNMAASIVLDTSGSMAFPPSGPTKFRYAVVLAAALSHLLAAQGDAIGLTAASTDRGVFVPARSGRAHLRRVLRALSSIRAGGGWRPADTVHRAADRLKRRGLLILLSDLYEDDDETLRELKRAHRMGHEVVLLQIISREEIDFPYRRDYEFADLETGRTLALNAAFARDAYRDDIAAFLDRCRSRAAEEGFQHSLVVTDMAPAHVLRAFLIARA